VNLLPSIDEDGNVVLTHRTLGKIATLERYEHKHTSCPALRPLSVWSGEGWFVLTRSRSTSALRCSSLACGRSLRGRIGTRDGRAWATQESAAVLPAHGELR
jgi:hypothetical protein